VRTVAALCVGPNSVYKKLPAVDAYDLRRNMLSFEGDCPVVAHPPCRSWSAFTRHQAKPAQGEKELGLFAAVRLARNGGVLEHPAHSHLFVAAGLPLPGETRRNLWTVQVNQLDWGHSIRKKTWLCFSRIDRKPVNFPAPYVRKFPDALTDGRKFKLMSSHQRSATPPAFAEWLVNCARLVA
jgi:hypothetical protein